MTKNARKNYIKAVSQQVDRKKMYKAKKNWVVAGMSFLVMAGLAEVDSHLTTHADTINANTKPNTVKQPSITDQATQLHNKIMNNNTYKLGAQPKQSSAVANQSTKSSNSSVSSTSTQSNVADNNSVKIVKDNKVNTQVNNNIKQAPTNVKNNQVKQSATKTNGNLSTSSTKQSNVSLNLSSEKDNNKGSNAFKLTNSNLNRNKEPLIKAHINHNLGDSNDARLKASDNHWIYDNGKYISSMPSTDTISDGTYMGLSYKYDKTLQALEFTGGSINESNTIDFLNASQFGGNGIQGDYDNSANTVLKSVKFNSDVDTSNVTNMDGMFYGDRSLQSLDLSHFNTSSVTNMGDMFYNDSSLQNLDVSHFNTSSVTNMSYMFYNDKSLQSLDLSHFNTSSVTNMRNMFYSDSSLQNLDVSHFNTSSVTNMSYMFEGDNALQSLDVSHFNTSSVTDMSYMFDRDSALQSLDLSNFNTSSVTDMSYMFDRDNALQNLDISHFNTSKVTGMSDMFGGNSSLQSLDLGNNFDTSNIRHKNMLQIFKGDRNLHSITVKNSNTKFLISGKPFNRRRTIFEMIKSLPQTEQYMFNKIPRSFDLEKMHILGNSKRNFFAFLNRFLKRTNIKLNQQTKLDLFNNRYILIENTPNNWYKQDINNNYTSPIPNDFTKGNIGTFTAVPNVPVDTVNYQYNGKTLATQQFKGDAQHYNGNGYSDLDVNKSNDKSIPNGYYLVNKDNKVPFATGTYNVAIATNSTTDTIHFVNQHNQNMGTTTTATGTPNNTFTISNIPAGYHVDTSKNPKTLTYDGKSHTVHLMSNSIKGTATVHLIYNETNGKVDNTKDVQVPINAHVGDNDMVITPWDYWKPNYNVKSNNVLTISFSPSIASNGDNNNYHQSDTFTYTGLSAASLVVKYVDTDSGVQPINPDNSDKEHRSDNQLVLGTQNLGQLGVVGSQVKLGQQGANDDAGVLDKLQVPKNFDLVNKVNYITLRRGQTVGATDPLGKAFPRLVGKRVMLLTVSMGTPSTKKNIKPSASAKPASTKAKQSSVSSAKPSLASKAVTPSSIASKSVTKKSNASASSAKSSTAKSSASSVASNIAKPSSISSVQSSAKSSAVSSKASSKSSSASSVASQSASSSVNSVESSTDFKSVVSSLDQDISELSLAISNEMSSAFSMSNSASAVSTSSSANKSTSSSADNGLVNFDDDRLYKVVEAPQVVMHKVGRHQYNKHLLIVHFRKHHVLFLERHHGFVMTLRRHNKISVRKIRYIHIHHGRVVIRLRNGRYVKVSRRYFHRIGKFLRK